MKLRITGPPPRGPKSLNFLDGKIQRANIFRTKCVNPFRDKKKLRKLFFATYKVHKSFCDSTVLESLTLQYN